MYLNYCGTKGIKDWVEQEPVEDCFGTNGAGTECLA